MHDLMLGDPSNSLSGTTATDMAAVRKTDSLPSKNPHSRFSTAGGQTKSSRKQPSKFRRRKIVMGQQPQLTSLLRNVNFFKAEKHLM